jgi:hypothetical protein
MTVSEAVRLVIQAGAIGRPGEVLVLDMGDPVRIVDMARHLMASVPQPVELRFSGLRPGEKLHEDLFGPGERDERPLHPLISQVPVPALAPSSSAVRRLFDAHATTEALVERMRTASFVDVRDGEPRAALRSVRPVPTLPADQPADQPVDQPVDQPPERPTERPGAGAARANGAAANGGAATNGAPQRNGTASKGAAAVRTGAPSGPGRGPGGSRVPGAARLAGGEVGGS